MLLTQYTFPFPSSSPFILFFSCFHCIIVKYITLTLIPQEKRKKTSTFKKLSTSFSIRSTNYPKPNIFSSLDVVFTILDKTPLLFRKYPKKFERSRNAATDVPLTRLALKIRRRYEIAVGKS